MKPLFDDAGIGLLAVSADPPADSADFIAEQGITVPLLSDPDLAVITAYGVAMDGEDIAVPATFIVDGGKQIHWRYIGENMTDRPPEEALLEQAKSLRKER